MLSNDCLMNTSALKLNNNSNNNPSSKHFYLLWISLFSKCFRYINLFSFLLHLTSEKNKAKWGRMVCPTYPVSDKAKGFDPGNLGPKSSSSCHIILSLLRNRIFKSKVYIIKCIPETIFLGPQLNFSNNNAVALLALTLLFLSFSYIYNLDLKTGAKIGIKFLNSTLTVFSLKKK